MSPPEHDSLPTSSGCEIFARTGATACILSLSALMTEAEAEIAGFEDKGSCFSDKEVHSLRYMQFLSTISTVSCYSFFSKNFVIKSRLFLASCITFPEAAVSHPLVNDLFLYQFDLASFF